MRKKCGMQNADCGIQKKLYIICRSFTPKSALRTPNSKGFTLIEVLIFIVMAGILLPAIVVPFATAVKGSGKPEVVNTAMYLAHERMEEFMKFDYGDATLNPTALTSYVNAPVAGYQWQWEILYVPPADLNAPGSPGPDTGYKRIHVRVQDPESDTYDVYSVVTDFP